MDFKIFNNNSEFQLDGNNGSLVSKKNQMIASEIRGSLGTYNYQLRFKDNLINFSIPTIKLEAEYQLKSDKLQNSFLQIKSANNLFVPGLDNIYLRANVIHEKDEASLEDIKLTSSTYNGFGSINFKTNPNLTITTDLTFGRTNFTNIGLVYGERGGLGCRLHVDGSAGVPGQLCVVCERQLRPTKHRVTEAT